MVIEGGSKNTAEVAGEGNGEVVGRRELTLREGLKEQAAEIIPIAKTLARQLTSYGIF